MDDNNRSDGDSSQDVDLGEALIHTRLILDAGNWKLDLEAGRLKVDF